MSVRWLAITAATLTCLVTAIDSSAVAQEPPKASTVLMARDGVSVTVQDVQRYVELMIPAQQRRRALSQRRTVRKIIANLYVTRQLAERAREDGLAENADIQWLMDTKAEQGLGSEYLHRRVQSQLAGIDWELAAREQYRANPEQYGRKARVKASHVLILTDDRPEKEARALAEKVRQKAIDGADFAELAEKYSEGSSAEKGGDIGFFTRSEVAPPFAEAAFALEEPGDISDVVKTQFGYHVIKLTERQPAKTPPFKKVRDRIIQSIQKDRRARASGAILTEIRSAEGIEVNQKAISALEGELRVPGPGGQNGDN